MGLQQLGVIPFEIRNLKKRYTEKWRTQRIVYNKAIVDTEAPLVRGGTEDGTFVILSFMLSPPCSPPLCVPFISSRLTLSPHISEEPELWFFSI